MYTALKHAHSGIRWVVLILLILAIFNAYAKWKNGSDFTSKDKKLSLFAMVFLHIQLLVGIAVYGVSPLVSFADGWMQNAATRFYSMEHEIMMLIAIILVSIGYSRGKRKTEAPQKFKTIFIFYLIGLVVILLAIPWPFRFPGAGWF